MPAAAAAAAAAAPRKKRAAVQKKKQTQKKQSGGDRRMSPREEAFETCSFERSERHPDYAEAFSGVRLMDSKMNAAEIDALRGFVDSEDIDVLSYDGLERVSDLLCRWPRPSEIGRVLDDANLKYAMAAGSFSVDSKTTLGEVIGTMGENLVEFTKAHNLLYAWVKNLKDGPRILLFYTTADGVIATKADETKIKSRGIDLIYRFFKSFSKRGVVKKDFSEVKIKSFSLSPSTTDFSNAK